MMKRLKVKKWHLTHRRRRRPHWLTKKVSFTYLSLSSIIVACVGIIFQCLMSDKRSSSSVIYFCTFYVSAADAVLCETGEVRGNTEENPVTVVSDKLDAEDVSEMSSKQGEDS